MSFLNFVRLSVMMFVQFFIWGAWYVTAPSYLGQIGFGSTDFGWTYSVGPIAGIISPFILGLIADRYFSTERVLGLMHILGGLAMLGAAYLMRQGSAPWMINTVFFAHMLCFYPTLSLTNTLAMHNMTDPEKQFPVIRVSGTIGWIIAGLVLGYYSWGATIDMFYLAAGAAILLGFYSFTLPHTPPPAAGKQFSAKESLGLNALFLLKKPSYLTFIVSSLLICIPLAFYYQMAARTIEQAGIANVPQTMSYGQVSEICFMLLMPLFFGFLGVKWMLAVGMLAWVLRYGLFSVGAPDQVTWMLLSGVILHGICYDFFFVTGQIYTDKVAPKEMRGQAQGLLVLFTLGIGMLVGAQIGGRVEKFYTPAESVQLSGQVEQLSNEIKALDERNDSGLAGQIASLTQEKEAKRIQAMQMIQWRQIWLLPCIGAAVILVVFVFLFRHDSPAKQEPGKPQSAA